jgi:hypothetical protein
MSTVDPAEAKKERAAQRTFQKSQWAALDASMRETKERKQKEALESESNKQANLAAQAAKARAKVRFPRRLLAESQVGLKCAGVVGMGSSRGEVR